MPFRQIAGIHYYTFENLNQANLTHAIFTRRGGTSPGPWDSLNVGATVGDEFERVAVNRMRAFDAVGRSHDSLYDVWQVHSAEVVIADQPRPLSQPHEKADAILSDKPGVTLFMRFADCVPILLHDPVRKVVGIAHAGWRGTILKTGKAAILAMQAAYGSNPQDVQAAIGPSICTHHYEVGEEVAVQVRTAFGADASHFLVNSNGVKKLNLWEANRYVLDQAGVHDIELSGICTACHLEDWYSHRAEDGHTGRFGVLIGLNDNRE